MSGSTSVLKEITTKKNLHALFAVLCNMQQTTRAIVHFRKKKGEGGQKSGKKIGTLKKNIL